MVCVGVCVCCVWVGVGLWGWCVCVQLESKWVDAFEGLLSLVDMGVSEI